MRDEEVRHAGLLADVGEQVEHLRLHGDVERRDGLVEDEHARLGGEGARDGDALALAAREVAGAAGGVRRLEAHLFEELGDACSLVGTAQGELGREHLGEAPADRLLRVERRVRILEDDLQFAAATPALGGADSAAFALASADGDGARRRLLESDQHARDRGLAGAGLADDRQRRAGFDRERHGIDGHDGVARAAWGGEGLAEVVDDDCELAAHASSPGVHGAACTRSRAREHATRPVPIASSDGTASRQAGSAAAQRGA